MDQIFFLILLNLSIGFGSYLAGTIPMILFMSESRMRLFSVFGAGILMGTALCVIIPEGINSIYETTGGQHHHHQQQQQQTESGKNSSLIDWYQEEKESRDPHTIIGLTLLFGFVMMLLIDQFSSSFSAAPSSSSSHYSQVPTCDNLENGPHSKDVSATPKMTATIGLIVHSAADGIALGAAATTSHADVEMVVFLAIMLHKAPAAFGLVTFLLHEGLDRRRTKHHLILFSLSAPVASFVTYLGLSSAAQEAISDYNGTGIALLFSAGTFLYVAAVHVLPEITQHRRLKMKELALLITGSFLPSLLTIKHQHHH